MIPKRPPHRKLRKKKKPGRDFEEAVHRFVRSLDPAAQVLFNHTVRDVHTDTPRQVDVWVTTTALGHFPQSILVRCKDYKRPLDIGHIDTFRSEVTSAGASTGVIYSRSGFSGAAVLKAKKCGLACCRLYRDQPADIPEVLFFDGSYLCCSTISLEVDRERSNWPQCTWAELLHHAAKDDGKDTTVIDLVETTFLEGEEWAINNRQETSAFPPGWETCVSLEDGGKRIEICVRGVWRRFRGRAEAQLVNGSYCFNNGTFAGTQTTPAIDTRELPGSGWEELSEDVALSSRPTLVITFKKPRLREALLDHFGPKSVY